MGQVHRDLADAFDPVAYLEQQLGRTTDRETTCARHTERFFALVDRQSALPGVEECLRTGKHLGLKTAVASSSSRAWVIGHLNRLGLSESFDCVRGRDDVARVKPDPELYQSALSALDVANSEAVAFEDSPNGIAAAKSAGMVCVAVPNVMTRDLALQEADLRLESLAEMPLADLLEKIVRSLNDRGYVA